MAITSQEFRGLSRGKKGKGRMQAPTVKAPKFNKKAKQALVPYGNQSPQRRANEATVL